MITETQAIADKADKREVVVETPEELAEIQSFLMDFAISSRVKGDDESVKTTKFTELYGRQSKELHYIEIMKENISLLDSILSK